ncbi:MAG: glycoside hydrolase family 3 N-terminal domain-containing protein, partial [Lachnospiraceae bacterium]
MVYKDSNKPIMDRVEDLIKRMTLKEKVAQLSCTLTDGNTQDLENMRNILLYGIGTLSYLNSSLSGDNQKDMNYIKEIQKYLTEETRLGIPALIHNEGIAGAQIPGATTFPQSMNVASTWEPELAYKMGVVVRKQLKAYGIHAVHSPLFDLGRDPRWGRIGETYGEDPYLVARMGTSYVKGIQGNNEIMATAKHFVGYGNAEGGRNGGEQQIAERKLLDTYCFPFEAAIQEANVSGIMNSYGILNEQAVSTSKWLLNDILRGKLGFQGVTVADYGSISHAHVRYHVAESQKDTAILALKAGMDIEQPQNTCYRFLEEAVETGEIEEELIDRSVRRLLEIKFKLGLFENPYSVGDFIKEIAKGEYEELTQEIAEKSIVMVKNEDSILPLRKNIKIALIGPGADTKGNFFGGYSAVNTASTTSRDFDRSEDDNFIKMAYHAMITEYKDGLKAHGIEFEDQPSPEQKEIILNMLKKRRDGSNKAYKSHEDFMTMFYPNCKSMKEIMEDTFGEENIIHAKGCGISTEIINGIEHVKAAIEQADIVVAVLGGKESMTDPEATCGENKDNININLEMPQLEMMEEVFKMNKPVVSVIIDGRPLAATEINRGSKAVLYSWLPAQNGAKAITNILTGKCNPSGKLPTTILKDSGQIPMYHSRLPFMSKLEDWAEYIDNDKNSPLYEFGHGLSYTQFEYTDLVMEDTVFINEKIKFNFKLQNTGFYCGDEIVQVYVRDCVASIARPTKQLLGFVRVGLGIGETKEVSFEIDLKQLAFHDLNMDLVVEPGDMEIYIGESSQDIRLQKKFKIIGDKLMVERKVFS